ncbi:MAG: O-methyltransferase [Mycobacteriales bacterium]
MEVLMHGDDQPELSAPVEEPIAAPADDALTAPMEEPPDAAELDELTEVLLGKLAAAGLVPAERPPFPAAAFHALDERVRAAFTVPHTTMTPLARRLLFGLAAARQARDVLVLGSFVGYAAVWVFGPALPPDPLYRADSLLACDVLGPAVDAATANFGALGAADAVRVVRSDAADLLARLDRPVDLLYLDVDSPEEGKRGYAPLLTAALPRLAPGALVLAHDVTHPFYRDDVAPYLALTRDREHFRRTATVEVDPCGLEITVR